MTIATASTSSTTTTTRAAMTGVLLFEGDWEVGGVLEVGRDWEVGGDLEVGGDWEVGGATVMLLSLSAASTEWTILPTKFLRMLEKKSKLLIGSGEWEEREKEKVHQYVNRASGCNNWYIHLVEFT